MGRGLIHTPQGAIRTGDARGEGANPYSPGCNPHSAGAPLAAAAGSCLSQRDSASESGVPSRFEAEPERLERLPAGQAAFLLRGDAKKRLQNKLPKKNQGTGSFTFFSAFFWRKNA